MSKFKVGDKVARVNGVPFSNGDMVVTIEKLEEHKVWFHETGTYLSPHDVKLVAESPIRTVTRKEIVPGVYGKVEVSLYPDGSPCILVSFPKTATELREAAHTLTQIAEALDGV